ncbi:hypothetical protein [uncultured Methanobrevibacter sp.]|uniref:hypothetical protein n=1 Tax=uncultured Methanobrevibacter sp. TaxID=253161 RepID=UPI002628156F
MNKKFKTLFLLSILLILSVNIAYASEINEDNRLSNGISEEVKVSMDTGDDSSSILVSESDSSDNESNLGSVGSGFSSDNESDLESVDSDSSSKNESDVADSSVKNKTDLIKTKITSNVKYIIYSNYLKVYLKDINGKALSNESVLFHVKSRIYNKTTDANGMAKLQINLKTATYKIKLEYLGSDIYSSSTKAMNLRVICKPIYTCLSIVDDLIYDGKYLKVLLKTKNGKAISNQKLRITINSKTYIRTTKANGVAAVKINLKSRDYAVLVKYSGVKNYMDSSNKGKVHVLSKVLLGSNAYGKVELLSLIGNSSSKIRIAYVVGLHPIEHQIHDVVYGIMKNKRSMKYAYYVYRVTVAKKSGSYSIDRTRGQMLAKTYVVPHVNKQKYNLMVDIHSTTGIAYKYSYFVHVPKNKHKASMKLANKLVKIVHSIEKNSKMRYYSPQPQTSPPYLTLPVMNAGTPTFVFETLTSEDISQTNKRANILINAIDKLFN